MSKDNAPIEMDLALGSAKTYGSSRSIVRRIATNLPLKPCPRVHFQLYPYTENAAVLIGTKRQHGFVASLADIGWIDADDENDEDDKDSFGRSRLDVPPGLMFRTCQSQRRSLTRQRSLPSIHDAVRDPQGPTTANDETFQKISALESELAKLRAQIAQIVLAQEKSTQPAATTGTSLPPPLPNGSLAAPLPPPPPPPPPPPLPPLSLQRTFSAIDLIKERRGKNTDNLTFPDSKQVEIPNMLDVLKDMSKVKLRSVKSRIVEHDAKLLSSEPVDAAALIAQALKRKFAHRYRNDSEQHDKENIRVSVPEAKPQTETPLFGQHLLKQTGRKKLL